MYETPPRHNKPKKTSLRNAKGRTAIFKINGKDEEVTLVDSIPEHVYTTLRNGVPRRNHV